MYMVCLEVGSMMKDDRMTESFWGGVGYATCFWGGWVGGWVMSSSLMAELL